MSRYSHGSLSESFERSSLANVQSLPWATTVYRQITMIRLRSITRASPTRHYLGTLSMERASFIPVSRADTLVALKLSARATSMTLPSSHSINSTDGFRDSVMSLHSLVKHGPNSRVPHVVTTFAASLYALCDKT